MTPWIVLCACRWKPLAGGTDFGQSCYLSLKTSKIRRGWILTQTRFSINHLCQFSTFRNPREVYGTNTLA